MSQQQPAPSVKGASCIHIYRSTNETCGKPVALDRQHGWLCDEHESVIARFNSSKQLERAS